eukprot:CAMPEP_0197627662 /NCGR_PEP_ID=MMETSP1338-20131121/6207_1 /TAXON_ID=43686 ORGANISM="Pelagodinium beii, Strain RCC1491" /NCGR_SAMPLE_ID=MMETSP1338 /ASSEMBLY_ACC=CAM_ASM_000754 /LENGTH=827 /DNA_ID=CAMNT_0043198437 /DNA_START=52 /DNA_END=2535 /DNA_ORIENTATION=-
MAEEPDAKRQKTEEDVEMKEEPPKELETDAVATSAKPLKEAVVFEPSECTLNVIPALGGRVLMPLTDGGLQYLMAGARANVGVKQGRYLYEVRIVESLSPSQGQNRSSTPLPRNLVKVGFSTKGSSLFLGENDQSVCFDSEGCFTSYASASPNVSQRFARDQTVAVLLNLDPSSPNKNTVSLFKDGVRVSQPQALPESLIGKTLFPHVSFKNVTLQVNFGAPMVPLPFKCQAVAQVSAADGEVGFVPPADGKYEVIFPMGVPDEGAFDWLDGFLATKPGYVELSDRSIAEWAEKSGIRVPRTASWKHSNDKPDLQLGIPMLDDMSARKVLSTVVASHPRNYVVMEMKSNLVKEDRQLLLKRFKKPCYKAIAQVVMGIPDAAFMAETQNQLLAEKQQKEEEGWLRRKAEKEREKQLRAEEAQRKAEEAAQRKAEEEAQRMAEEAAKQEAGEEGEVKKEEVKEEVKEEPKDVEMKVEEEPEEPKPVAQLTEEEKAISFRKKAVPDLTSWILSSSFMKFSIPDADEGFDEVRYAWSPEGPCRNHLHQWILKNKVLQRIEEITPSEWFRGKYAEWQRLFSDWTSKQSEFRSKGDVPPPPPPLEGQDGEMGEKPPQPEKTQVEDVFAVEDICDISNGEPLFAKFEYEDWTLLSLRLELHLMVHSFKEDANDPERVGIHEQNLSFYYSKYFKKTFSLKTFQVESNRDLVGMVKDTVAISQENQVLQAQLGPDIESFDIFVKLTEEARRERMRRLDSGDMSANLSFLKPELMPPPAADKGGHKGYKGGGYKGGKGYKGDGGYKGGKGYQQGGQKGYGKGYGGQKGGGYNKGYGK